MIISPIKELWAKYISILGLVGIVVALYRSGIPLDQILTTVTLFLVIFIVVSLSLNVGPYLSSIDRTLKDIQEILNRSGPRHQGSATDGAKPKVPDDKEEIKTKGGGALAGMTVGGLIGLIGGPVGVIVGGLIGSLVGNQLEYENTKAEKQKTGKT